MTTFQEREQHSVDITYATQRRITFPSLYIEFSAAGVLELKVAAVETAETGGGW